MIELSFIDQAFFKLEQGGMSPAYMGGASIFQPGGPKSSRLTSRKLVDHLAARLEKIPLLRKKLVQDPLRIGNMRLVDDSRFDIHNHLTCVTLQRPGGYRELTGYLGEFSARRLDFSRPPWHFEIVRGLEGGRFAMAYHLHHSLIDGVGAVAMMRAIHDTEPVAFERPGSGPWQAETEPTPGDLLRGAVKENAARLFVKLPAAATKTVGAVGRALPTILASGRNPDSGAAVKLPRVHRTSLNVGKLSDRRVVSFAEFPLAEIKALCRRFGCSVNDLSMLLNSCALEHYFREIGEVIDFDLVAAMPVNMRKPDDRERGNRLAVSRVSLHNRIDDLRERLGAIARDTAAIKRSFNRLAESEILAGLEGSGDAFSPIILDAVAYLVTRFNLTAATPVLNVLVTNVAGSPDPLYFASARQVSGVPMAPCTDGLGLSITVNSTDERLLMGYHGCGRAVRDKELFVEGVHRGFAAISAARRHT